MENASKALIIAGAILLAILIIGIGMFIYQQAAGQISDTGLDEQTISTFNAKFLAYEGKVTGTEARSLCDLVRQNNLTNAEEQINLINVAYGTACTGATNVASPTDGQAAAQTAKKAKNSIKQGRSYEVTFDYNSTGVISAIGIVDKSGSSGSNP